MTRQTNLSDVPRTDQPHLDRYLRDIRDAWAIWQGERNPLDRRVSVSDLMTALRATNTFSEPQMEAVLKALIMR